MNQTPGHNMLTLITCYPFQFVGSAPQRLIVQAQPVSQRSTSSRI
jgi:LPXTG-site transpeptidase (sortase) family protein